MARTDSRVFAFLSAPIDTTQHQTPLLYSQTCRERRRSRRRSRSRGGPEGQLDAAVAGVGLLALKPTPSSHFCQCPLTCLLPSHHLRFSPHPQFREQQDRVRGRLRARRHPQGDADHQPGVCRRPSVCFSVNAPFDMPDLSQSLLCSSPTVWDTTVSEMRVPPRSPESSRRRTSLT